MKKELCGKKILGSNMKVEFWYYELELKLFNPLMLIILFAKKILKIIKCQ